MTRCRGFRKTPCKRRDRSPAGCTGSVEMRGQLTLLLWVAADKARTVRQIGAGHAVIGSKR